MDQHASRGTTRAWTAGAIAGDVELIKNRRLPLAVGEAGVLSDKFDLATALIPIARFVLTSEVPRFE